MTPKSLRYVASYGVGTTNQDLRFVPATSNSVDVCWRGEAIATLDVTDMTEEEYRTRCNTYAAGVAQTVTMFYAYRWKGGTYGVS